MTISRVLLSPGEDIHLLPGTVSPRLDQLLFVEESEAAGGRTYRFIEERPFGVTVSFGANFDKADPRTAGIDVDANFGEVSVDTNLPSPERLLDFIVMATVSDGATFAVTTHVRVCIHDAFRNVWLTPAGLTARKFADLAQPVPTVRFTILAEFSDGTYGDLTNWLPRHRMTDPTDRRFARTIAQRDVPIFSWDSHHKGNAQIDVHGGWLLPLNNGTTTIELSTPNLVPGASATAAVQVAPPWTTPVDLRLVEGPGVDQMEDVPNVLFLPEGFTEGEQNDFERIVRQLVHRLRVRRRTRPFDLLKDRINYFCAWVASPEAGVSVLEEVETTGVVGGPDTAEYRSTNVAEGNVAAAWHVGTPSVNATRVLLNERNTAFHVVLGGRPNAARFYRFATPRLNTSQRIGKTNLDDFFAALRGPTTPGLRVGKVWMRPDEADGDPLRGKDEGLVVFVYRCHRAEGVNYAGSLAGKHLCVSLCEEDDAFHSVQANPNGDGLDVIPDSIPARVQLQMCSLAAHELCHTFSLGDEYGSDYPGRNTSVPPTVLPPDHIAAVRKHPNVQARADLLTNGSLDADKIQWRWPRIEKAGVLAEPLDPLSSVGAPPFRLRLEPGHATLFKADDVVRLRKRPLLMSGPPSYRLRVVDVQDNSLVVDPLEPTPDAEAQLAPYYVRGSIVMAPRRGPDSGTRLGDDLLLVHESAITVIDDTHNPLNARPLDAPNRPCGEVLTVNTPTPATNFEEEPPRPPRQSGLRVGLYENGASYDGDVYRPTGMCFMRTSRVLSEENQAGEDLTASDQRLYQRFCPVCRYALVDLLDPSQHGRIDRDYDKIYPE